MVLQRTSKNIWMLTLHLGACDLLTDFPCLVTNVVSSRYKNDGTPYITACATFTYACISLGFATFVAVVSALALFKCLVYDGIYACRFYRRGMMSLGGDSAVVVP